MEYTKTKSPGKVVFPRGPKLREKIMGTLKLVADVVGSTLGPGGRPVLLERQEHGLAPLVTKDGVTVYRALGFKDPTAHCILESARDGSVRTANEAGDGTTSCAILSYSIAKAAEEFTAANPNLSPQWVSRELESAFRDVLEPALRSVCVPVSIQDRDVVKAVAKLSANGDEALADAVLECYDICGDAGNVTITEAIGPNKYVVEHVDGYPIATGYEETCRRFYTFFVTDGANQRCYLEKPRFVLYNGTLTEPGSILPVLQLMGQEKANGNGGNIVVVANGFSEQVLAFFATNFSNADAINPYPLQVPLTPFPNCQQHFLEDLSALTGASIRDPINSVLADVTLEDLGPGLESFESYRFKSTITGSADEDRLFLRIDELQAQLENAGSQLDTLYLQERLAKLSEGIARLKVVATSNAEQKEKRDRAEDSVCAVRGALKHGCVPGGGWCWLYLQELIRTQHKANKVLMEVLVPALNAPVECLFENAGFVKEQREKMVKKMTTSSSLADPKTAVVYDFLAGAHVVAFEAGILDSAPAVVEALRNSIGIASLLGSLGGTVVFDRDLDADRHEAYARAEFERDQHWNPANDRS